MAVVSGAQEEASLRAVVPLKSKKMACESIPPSVSPVQKLSEKERRYISHRKRNAIECSLMTSSPQHARYLIPHSILLVFDGHKMLGIWKRDFLAECRFFLNRLGTACGRCLKGSYHRNEPQEECMEVVWWVLNIERCCPLVCLLVMFIFMEL